MSLGNISEFSVSLKIFLHAKIKRGYTGVETILHFDQGPVYSSRAFLHAHKNYNITHSMSRSGTPTDNLTIEALNGWIKVELYENFNL